MRISGCPYCDAPGGRVVWSDEHRRVVLIDDSPFAGLCRVVWNDHVKELTDLDDGDRRRVFNTLAAAERAIRDLLAPDKMNLAALGTQVPHLHWHVVPRFTDDTHYPDPIWAPQVRSPSGRRLPPDFASLLTRRLGELHEQSLTGSKAFPVPRSGP